jgi:ATP-binding cassette subfamily B protein
MAKPPVTSQPGAAKPKLFSILSPYKGIIGVLAGLSVVTYALNLVLPKIVSHGIDALGRGQFVASSFVILFASVVCRSSIAKCFY